MPNQKYIVTEDQDAIIPVAKLNIGELGEIVDSLGHDGLIVVKCFNSVVCVFSSRKSMPAFETVWSDISSLKLKVRLLKPNEIIQLHN